MTVFSFQEAHEEVPYALCRWLRARKYNLADTIKMVEEATECTSEPRKEEFFPYPEEALSVETSLYIKQYPQFYFGHAKNGCPVFISQPGRLNLEGITNLTCIPNIIKYHWYAMMHEYVHQLDSMRKTSNGKFKRYECVCILDLSQLTVAKVGKRATNITKVQSAIDSLCFPETLNKMVIVNAPGFFTMTWKVIRGWIDQRTAAKVEVIGSCQRKLLETLSNFVDPDELPSDYGGNGKSIEAFLRKDMLKVAESKREAGSTLKLHDEDPCLVSFKGKSKQSITVEAKKVVKLSFLTRTLDGCTILVKDASTGKVMSTTNAVHKGNDDDNEGEVPTRFNLEDQGIMLQGPGKFDVEFISNGGRFKVINVMMAVRTFVRDAAKISSDNGTVAKKQPQAVIDNSDPNMSICTGTFSSGETLNLSVTASPRIERKMSLIALKQTRRGQSQLKEDGDYGGIPKVNRVTTGRKALSLPKAGKEETNGIGSNYTVSDSPHRAPPKSCGIFLCN